MDNTYTQSGTYIALAGLLVAALSHFGIVVTTSDAVQVIAGLVTLAGIVKAGFDHKATAQAAGYCD